MDKNITLTVTETDNEYLIECDKESLSYMNATIAKSKNLKYYIETTVEMLEKAGYSVAINKENLS